MKEKMLLNILFILLLGSDGSLFPMDRFSHRRPELDKSCLHDAKRSRIPNKREEEKRDLLAQLCVDRLYAHDFLYDEYDVAFVNTVIDVASRFNVSPQENSQDLEIIQYVFSKDVYRVLARYLVANTIVHVNLRLYNPDKLLAETSLVNNALKNAELLLQSGADPNVALPYPIVRKNRLEYTYMCGLSVYTREEDLPRLRLLLRYGANPNIRYKEENLLCNVISERKRCARHLVNLLLYYGANVRLPLLIYKKSGLQGKTPLECAAESWRLNPYSSHARDLYELCLNGPARRAERMAHYLWRVINGNGIRCPKGVNGCEFPFELCCYIVELVYGNLKGTNLFSCLKNCSDKKLKLKR
jgi:hypothetical protein